MQTCVVGLGRMGLEMATRAADAGLAVHGIDVAPAALLRAAERGIPASGEFDAIDGAEIVLSSLPDTKQVVAAYLDRDGILERLAPGSVCVDLSTIAPSASVRVADTAASSGIDFLDAPVSGTSVHAAAGTLAIMVGGDAAALERARPVLTTLSRSIHHVGGNGSGLLLKLVTNRLLAAHLVGIAEAVVSMESVGLDVAKGIEFLRSSAVPQLLEYKAEPLAARDYEPQFTVDLMRKDLRLADEALLPGEISAATVSVFDETVSLGLGAADIAAVMAAVEREGPDALSR